MITELEDGIFGKVLDIRKELRRRIINAKHSSQSSEAEKTKKVFTTI